MAARIYRPAKTAMQSGKAKTEVWMLEFEPEQPCKVEPLMGYTSSGDMKSQIRLSFETKEEAIAYAQKNGIAYSGAGTQGNTPSRCILFGELPISTACSLGRIDLQQIGPVAQLDRAPAF